MEKVKKATVKMRVSAIETLLAIPIGETVMIKFSVIKPTTVRGMARKLNLRGYDFKVTEAKRPDYTEVKRNK
ncbi:MAG: hypothetical protein LBR26_09620 [Prevotella sp.]|jgi:hypothetical protein|nr:hypothetical protein [Prevotella sp.]